MTVPASPSGVRTTTTDGTSSASGADGRGQASRARPLRAQRPTSTSLRDGAASPDAAPKCRSSAVSEVSASSVAPARNFRVGAVVAAGAGGSGRSRIKVTLGRGPGDPGQRPEARGRRRRHASRLPQIRVFDLDDLTMLIGPDQSARLLEIGVAHAESVDFVVHAMPARPRFLE